MRDTNRIIEAYEQGDSCQRLSLYLEYPHLRRLFAILEGTVKMDKDETPSRQDSASSRNWQRLPSLSSCIRMIRGRLGLAAGS